MERKYEYYFRNKGNIVDNLIFKTTPDLTQTQFLKHWTIQF